MSTALKIKELSKIKKISLKSLADEIDLSEAGFHKMLKTENFWIKDLFKISTVLNVSIYELLSIEELQNPDPKTIQLQNEILNLKSRIEELTEQLNDKKIIIDFINKNNLLDGNAIEKIDSPEKFKYRPDGKLSLDYLIYLMEKEKNKDGSLSAEKLELVKKKIKEEYERKTDKM